MEPVIKISVIVPVYNNVQYLRQCFDSLVNQTLKDIEVIMIDDGSTDPEVFKICKKYEEQDNRFRAVHQENRGAGAAINKGIDMATGVYFCEQDCDDWREPDALEQLWKQSENGTIDVVKGTWYGHYNGQIDIFESWPKYLTEKVFNPLTELTEREKIAIIGSCASVWAGIYKMDFLKENGIRWRETPGAKYQDTAFALKTKTFAKSMKLFNEPVYEYRMDNSESQTAKPTDPWAIASEIDSYEHMLKRENINIWTVLSRIRVTQYLWACEHCDEKDKAGFIARMSEDFTRDVHNREFYSESEWTVLKHLVDMR